MSEIAIATHGVSEALPTPLAPGRRAPAVPRPSRMRPAPRTRVVRSEDDVVRAVSHARMTGARVRAVGADGSKNGNTHTTGCRLDLSAYDRLVRVDGDRVTVQAGMTVARLQELLEQCGLALPTPGEWNGATVAGAVSTGTHGGSRYHGCISTSLEQVRVVTGRGTVEVWTSGDQAFRHAGVSLGLLGVLSELTFRCVPRFDLVLERRLETFDQFLQDHPRAMARHEFHSAVWFPRARRVLSFAADRHPTGASGSPRSRRRPRRYCAINAALMSVPGWTRLGRGLTRRAFHTVARGSSDQILSPLRASAARIRWLRRVAPEMHEVEFAVPLDRGGEALEALEALLGRWKGALKLPVGIRPTAADDFSLSPCSGGDVLWISTFARNDPELAAALAELFGRFDARCHWGKNMAMTPDQLRGRYPEWASFQTARSRLDPDGIFLNPFTEAYLK